MRLFKSLILAIMLFLPAQVFAQGGDDPVEGIDIIIKREGLNGNVTGIRIYYAANELAKVNQYKGLKKPDMIAKIAAPKLAKKLPKFKSADSWYKTLSAHLIKKWCVDCNGGSSTLKVKGPDGMDRMVETVTIRINIKPSRKMKKEKVKAGAIIMKK